LAVVAFQTTLRLLEQFSDNASRCLSRHSCFEEFKEEVDNSKKKKKGRKEARRAGSIIV